jgi:hypothetical protein
MLLTRLPRLLAALWLWAGGAAAAATVNIDIQKQYGAVSLVAINRAISDARAHFAAGPNDVVVLQLPPGIFRLELQAGSPPSIDVSDVTPGPGGQLVLRGAGKDLTTLVFDTGRDEIMGRNAHRVSFTGLHFTLGHMTVSQGHVVQLLPDAVLLRIEDGFPTPAQLDDGTEPKKSWLRRCTDSASAPEISQDDNGQVHWWRSAPVSPGIWRLDLKRTRGAGTLNVGDLVAIKEKRKGDETFHFLASSDLTFDDIAWSRATRGVFRAGTYNVQVLHASILREPPVNGQAPCISSAAGGPQFGQPDDPPMTGIVVRDYTARGTGDDALAFFNASGTVDDVRISDSFARGILLYRSPGITLSNVQVTRAPILHAN